ncbi:MAG: Glyoxalase/bleomycin resistance protein/dioxygenase [Acidobacteriales bacterium]|nr:Glyoxalase/bleomycin resistance protein/dioxygenase [Terriglobales bacterium]
MSLVVQDIALFELDEHLKNAYSLHSMATPQPDYGNGKICYIEIPSNDIPSSAAFYKDVFGWNIRTRGDGSTTFDDGVGQVSGIWIRGRKPSDNPSVLIYIMVDSASATLESIVAHGGKITQPIGMDAPEITARFSDPAGNIFGIYQQPS